jgi:hypothetical protein
MRQKKRLPLRSLPTCRKNIITITNNRNIFLKESHLESGFFCDHDFNYAN